MNLCHQHQQPLFRERGGSGEATTSHCLPNQILDCFSPEVGPSLLKMLHWPAGDIPVPRTAVFPAERPRAGPASSPASAHAALGHGTD